MFLFQRIYYIFTFILPTYSLFHIIIAGKGPLPAAARRGGGEGHHDSLRLPPPPLTLLHVFFLLFFSQHNVHVQILENKECNVYVFINIWTSLS